MTTQIKAKLLQHFAAKKKGNGGFTLIELLVVIIIIGILSAIALPSFLNQANKARQSEAKTYVGSINRGQQAYYLENGEFASTMDEVGIGIVDTTGNYAYTITAPTTAAPFGVTANAAPLPAGTASTKAYIGGVEIISNAGNAATTVAVLCEAVNSPAGGGADGTQTVTYAAATNTARCDNSGAYVAVE
ncbi:MAG: type IV pilin-like G/H family protein [Phormidesmis sp.]